MASKTERQRINEAREKYARRYAGRLKEKDGIIARLHDENDALKAEIALLRADRDAGRAEIAGLEKMLGELSEKTGMTPEDLEAFRKDMAARAKGAEAMAQLAGMARAMGAMGGLYGG